MVISRCIQTQVNVADKVNLAIRKATTFGHLRTLVHEHRFETTGSVDYGAHWIYIKFRVEREWRSRIYCCGKEDINYLGMNNRDRMRHMKAVPNGTLHPRGDC